MKWFRKTIALLLLALWVPTTSHCLIESTGLLPDFLCCADACGQDSSQPAQDEDSCVTLESASYRLDEQGAIVTALPLDVFWKDYFANFATADPMPAVGARLSFAEPDLSVTWQFSQRTALPPRAPSSVS